MLRPPVWGTVYRPVKSKGFEKRVEKFLIYNFKQVIKIDILASFYVNLTQARVI